MMLASWSRDVGEVFRDEQPLDLAGVHPHLLNKTA